MRAPLILLMAALLPAAPPAAEYAWQHLSSANGDLPAPNRGNEQTSLTVADFDRDGVNDFVVTERTAADSVVLYLRGKSGWSRSVIEPQPLHIEAGSLALDVDGDGDLDFIAAGDYKSNEIWWWENPYPDLAAGRRGSAASSRIPAVPSTTTRPRPISMAAASPSWSSGTRMPTPYRSPRCRRIRGTPAPGRSREIYSLQRR